MLLHFGFQVFLKDCFWALKIPYSFNFKIWNVGCTLLNEDKYFWQV